MNNKNKIADAVKKFMAGNNVMYATPGTDNHDANFYGHTEICELTESDIIACIECARDSFVYENCDPTDEAIEDILSDLQFEKPE